MKAAAVLILALAFSGSTLADGNPEKGRAKAEQVCAACHGADGTKPVAPENPILAGQYDDYIERALADYKSGKRANPVMKTFAEQLSKRDMRDLAAWFSSQKSSLHFQR
jgi:cytochrome c553